MSNTRRAARIGLLAIAATAWFYWVAHHAEVTFADGLRSIQQAREIGQGGVSSGLIEMVEHPLHSVAVLLTHRVFGGGDIPYAWQTAAQGAATLALVLAVIPLYLVGRELYDDTTALLGTILLIANPVTVDIGVNVLSQSTFLLFWSWGLWGAIRFLREGRFVWLPPTVLFGSLAYLTRPEGLVLHIALVLTLVALPLYKTTRIHWPRWWLALSFLVLGPALLVGPYVAMKGGIDTRPAVARLIGTEPKAAPTALERAEPLPEGRGLFGSHALAVAHVAIVLAKVATFALIPLAILGFVVGLTSVEKGRTGLFVGVVIGVSVLGLIRLDETAGYCEPRHALIPGIFLAFAAARGFVWLSRSFSIDGSRIGLGEGRLRPGPGVWFLLFVSALALPIYPKLTLFDSSFARYRQAGSWIAEHPDLDGRVLDLTDWSLFFSEKPGRTFKDINSLSDDPRIRFVVLKRSQLAGKTQVATLLGREMQGASAVAAYPEMPKPGQNQVLILDLGLSRVDEIARRIR